MAGIVDLPDEFGLADQPVALYKSGIFGSVEHDFIKVLASDYEAQYLSSEEIRWDIVRRNDKAGLPPDFAQVHKANHIKSIIDMHASDWLHQDEDVFIDGYYNSIKTRDRFRRMVARLAA